MDYNTTRLVECMVCGKRFRDDCGDTFCCSYCESEYEKEHAECEMCGREVGEDNLNSCRICENCEEEDGDEE